MSINTSINNIYAIQNVETGAYLCLSGAPTGLYNNYPVVGKSYSNTIYYHWYIDNTNGSTTNIVPAFNTSYGLNASVESTSSYTCKLYWRTSTPTTCSIIVSPSSIQGMYTIKLENYNKYLTLTSSASGSAPIWSDNDNSYNQKWYLTKISTTNSSTTLTMPVNANQRYEGQHDWIKEYGCAACCAADVASYYDKNNDYTVWQLMGIGAVNTSSGVIWPNVPAVNFTDYTSSSMLKIIRDEITAKRPVLIHLTGTRNGYPAEHWIVAYKFTNYAATNDFVECLDPYGVSAQSAGRLVTINGSANIQNMTNISYTLKLTSAK